MQTFNIQSKNKSAILALGAESAGNFSVYYNKKIYFSRDFGDLLIDANFNNFKNKLNKFLRENKLKPDIILTDLHPLYKTTSLGQALAKKYKAKYIQVQHHLAHIFSAYGEKNLKSQISNLKSFIGIALDGTGYGLDDKIWGGEIFRISNVKYPMSNISIKRIGHLENQTMIGGDLAVKEPARIFISILSKLLPKDKIYALLKKQSFSRGHGKMSKNLYTRNQFKLLYNQLQQNFNCQETSSTGRILDAVSILLGFCKNERNFKHEPAILLEQNSTKPYTDLKPMIKKGVNLPLWKRWLGGFEKPTITYQLDTTYLFKYLFKYLHRDKKRLAATAQLYIAEGLYEIIKKSQISNLAYRQAGLKSQIFLSGGLANNKIISDYLISKGAIVNIKIPRGDAGISFGQIIYFLIQK